VRHIQLDARDDEGLLGRRSPSINIVIVGWWYAEPLVLLMAGRRYAKLVAESEMAQPSE
jgi:hypothetical protein